MRKKMLKKTGATVITMAMVLSMGAIGITANATVGTGGTGVATDGTTITAANATYNIYLVAKPNASTGVWDYQTGFSSTTATAPTDLKNLTAAELKAVAANFARQAADNNIQPINGSTAVVAGTSYQTTEADGYYLITTQTTDAGTVVEPILQEVKGTDANALIAPKTPSIPFDKKITNVEDGEKDTDGNTSTGIIGSTVSYQIFSQIPKYDSNVTASDIKNYVITDDPSSGITIDNTNFASTGSNVVVTVSDDSDLTTTGDNVVLYTNAAAQAGYDSVAVANNDDGFKVTIPGSVIKAAGTGSLQGKYVFVTFNATVNNSAILNNGTCGDATTAHDGKTGNPNTAKVEYGNDYSTGSGNGSKHDTVTTYVGKLDFLKTDKATTPQPLANAEFTLSGPTGFEAKTLTTDANGKFDFGYLPAGTYTLTETKAPTGKKAVAAYTFTVANSTITGTFDELNYTAGTAVTNVTFEGTGTGDAKITIADPDTDTLPHTGGMGTTLFTVGGAAIVLLAGGLFVFYMKKRKVEE